MWDARNSALLTKTGTTTNSTIGGANVIAATGASYFSLPLTVNLAGDFLIGFKVSVTTEINSMVIGTPSNNNWIWLYDGARINIRCSGTSVTTAAASAPSTSLATYHILRVSNTLSLYINGSFVQTIGTNSGTFSIITLLNAFSALTYALSGGAEYFYMFNGTATSGDISSLNSDPYQILVAPAATATTLSGPSSGTVSVASTNFTVGANGAITGTVTVTPADGGAGGTFTPTSVAISSGTPTATFTYTPASTGAKTISITDDGALTDATSLTYTSNAAGGTYAPRLFTPRSGMGVNFYGAR